MTVRSLHSLAVAAGLLSFALATCCFQRDAAASVVRLVSLAELARKADVIVEGQVVAARAVRLKGIIFTDYTLLVSRDHRRPRGVPAARSVLLRLPGGVLGGVGMSVAGAPRLRVGQRLLVFGARYHHRVVPLGLAAGLLQLAGNRAVRDLRGLQLLRRTGGPVQGTRQVHYLPAVRRLIARRAR